MNALSERSLMKAADWKIKDCKKKARQTLKKDYWRMVAVCFIIALLCGVHSASVSLVLKSSDSHLLDTAVNSLTDKTGITNNVEGSDAINPYSGGDSSALILQMIGKLTDADPNISGAQIAAVRTAYTVLSALIPNNSVLSNLLTVMNSVILRQFSIVTIILTVVLLLRFLYSIFISNILLVGEKRFFLETRLYHDTQLYSMFHTFHVGRVKKAAKVMFLKYLFNTLWWLTIIGGAVKHYEYAMIPWLLSENPDLDWKTAHALSKEMMKGNKLHAFFLDFSFIGWNLLSVITSGLSDCFFAAPYSVGAWSELYMVLRADYISKNGKYAECFCDIYLTERPSDTPESVYGLKGGFVQLASEIKIGAVNTVKIVKTGAVKAVDNVAADFTEAVKPDTASKLRQSAAEAAIGRTKMKLDIYPRELSPIQPDARLKEWEERPINAGRHYGFTSYILLFFIFSFVGWVWEVSLHLAQTGEFANRGTLFGPWLPIYGTGGVVVLLFFRRWLRNPVLTFAVSSIACTTIEYFTSLAISLTSHVMYWDYTGMFMNFQGRICLAGAIAFGIGSMGFIYFIAPRLDDWLILRIPMKARVAACALLLALFGCDAVYSHFHPNIGKGITDTACILSPDDFVENAGKSISGYLKP